MAKYGMFRSDNMAGTTQGKYLASVRVAQDLQNGSVVALGDYEPNEREVRTCTAPTADTNIGAIAILGSEEVVLSAKYDTVGDFTNKKGTVARGYILEHGDIFSATAPCFEGTPEVGHTIEIKAASYKMATTAEATGATVIGKCIAVERDGATTWYVVRV
jgi:hypothetical protein